MFRVREREKKNRRSTDVRSFRSTTNDTIIIIINKSNRIDELSMIKQK